MYIRTIKLKKTVFAAAVVTVAAAAVLAAGNIAKKLAGEKRVYKVQTEQQRQALISELGWQTGDKPSSHKTITIPEHFDDVYEGYNELQKEQGFDLSGHRGRKAELYTYEIYNYPDHPDCMQLTLIGEDGVLIGGDVCCTELDGFMQGLLPSDKDICVNNDTDKEKTAVTETGSLDNDSSS